MGHVKSTLHSPKKSKSQQVLSSKPSFPPRVRASEVSATNATWSSLTTPSMPQAAASAPAWAGHSPTESDPNLGGISYRLVDGRRLLNVRGLKYMLPHDELEIDRLQMQHYIFRYLFQGNFSAPVHDLLRSGATVLDAGCGPGSWTMEMATEFSKTMFIGIDIANSFPTAIVPPNCTFRITNMVEPLPFENATFDFIYMRSMALAFTKEQWPLVLSELMRVLKPGGYLEWTEQDLEFKRRGPIFTKWNDQVLYSLRARDISPTLARSLQRHLQSTQSATNVRKTYVSLPIGRWGGRCGDLARSDFEAVMKALKPSLLIALGISSEDYDSMCEKSLVEFEEYKTYGNVYVCTAEKVGEHTPPSEKEEGNDLVKE
ncbi:uncharacterized protein VTP21DRAFT_9374 [Calcarisporiella thermophila]|uniref:uncharacterized protein n=1 Tax=Calcarisporiella thermophila TaxID=911321 RepID=UPI003744A482